MDIMQTTARPHSEQHHDGGVHHHHTHAARSAHPGHHHLLVVEDLCVSFNMYEDGPYFSAKQHEVNVLRNLNISVHEGEIVAVVGASGSGKTLLADATMGLYEPNSLVSGTIWFDGEEVGAKDLESLRGRGISLVPQSVAYLDPLMKLGRQVKGFAGNGATRREVLEIMERYSLSPDVAEMYPHQLSGGMLRRILLCCALIDKPKLIIADEPTPGLDLDLALLALRDFRSFADDGGGVLLITHDLDLALEGADRVAVFKDGTIVEETAASSFASPELLKSEFARQLWRALPEHDFKAS